MSKQVVISKLDGKNLGVLNITENDGFYLVQGDSQAYSDHNATVETLDEVYEIAINIRNEEFQFAKATDPQIEVLTEAEIHRQVYNG